MPDQPDLHSLAGTLADLGADIASQNQRIGEQNALITRQNEQLKKFVPRSRLWLTVAALVVAVAVSIGVLVVAFHRSATDRDEAIHRNACALRGVLSQAQSAGSRNPLPASLDADSRAFVEESRKRAQEFYTSALADIDATLHDLGGPPCANPIVPPG